MYQVASPLPLFLDSDGTPLEGGYAYYGLINQNPETAPQAVYWDEAGTQPAAQPLRISGGYLVRNNALAALYISGDYSITVKNKNSELVYYRPLNKSPDTSLRLDLIDSTIGDSIVAVKNTGSGSASRTQHDKNQESVYLTDFTATGGDYSVAIMAAHAALPSAGGEIAVPAGNYSFATSFTTTKQLKVRGLGTPNTGGTDSVKFTCTSAVTGDFWKILGGSTCIESIGFEGSNIAGTGDGIVIQADRVVLRDLRIQAFPRDGLRIGKDGNGGGGSGINANAWRIDNVTCQGNLRYGCKISDNDTTYANPSNANSGTAINLQALSNGSHGVYINQAADNTFIGTLTDTNGGHGVHIGPNADWNTFTGGDLFEANTTKDLYLEASAGYGGNMFIGTRFAAGRYTDLATNTIIINEGITILSARDADFLLRTGAGPSGMISANGTSVSINGTIFPGVLSGVDGTDPGIYKITGATPNNVVSAKIGSICFTTNGGAGTTFWVKESSPTANTGWVGK